MRFEEEGLGVVQPAGWRKPKGYANGMTGRGRLLLTGGLIGWNENEDFAEGFVAQVEQTLKNVVAVVAAAGGEPQHVARLTWYVRSIATYKASLGELGGVYRRVLGRHYPAMALVEVADLVENEALVEIEATAIIPD
ncbi:RidA family protein [Jiella sonneratiae]|nr:RidA family protein [Jiella sonneratiae]